MGHHPKWQPVYHQSKKPLIMKSKGLFYIWLIAWLPALSQNITQVEYFIDEEIITGSGHSEAVSPGIDVNHTLTFNTDTFSPGLHNFYFRVKDATGLFSSISSTVFYKPAEPEANLSSIEYFIDNEIISGNGHTEVITPGTYITHVLNINSGSLIPGIHNIYFRVKDGSGMNSPTYSTVFYKLSDPVSNIDLLEYYIDNEIISGQGHQVNISPSTEVVQVLNFDTLTVAHGLHNIYLRVRNENGPWSQMYQQIFYFQPIIHDIVAVEYFLNEDPGFGNGIQFPITPGKEVIIPFDIATLPSGKHILHIRAKDSNGNWSVTWNERIYLLSLKAILEGPYNNGAGGMNTTLNSTGLLPLHQPYDANPQAQWYYTGTDSVQTIPGAQVVDWVLVQIRDAATAAQATPATIRETKPAFLLSDGSIVDLNGSPKLLFKEEVTQTMFVCVFHRNHAGLMTSTAVPQSGAGAGVWDFTTGPDKVYGGIPGNDQLSPTLWGMITGDGNGDGQINNKDKNDVIPLQLGQTGYKDCDFNLDGLVDSNDKDIYWRTNGGKGSQIIK
jgi:hypothetical protein